jgi:hypothetical protein
MAEAIASLLADPARAAAMGTAARALAVNHYDWAAAMAPVLRLFGVEAAPADIAVEEQPPADLQGAPAPEHSLHPIIS